MARYKKMEGNLERESQWEGDESGYGRLSKLFGRRKIAAGANHRIGKRATSIEELKAEARAYVCKRMYEKGGFFGEAVRGLRHKTIPTVFGAESSGILKILLLIFVRLLIMIGAAFLPILSRRSVLSKNPPDDGIGGLVALLHDLSATDYVLGALFVLFLGVPKAIEAWSKRGAAQKDSPYTELSAAMEKMPSLDAMAESHLVKTALTHALHALRIEMSDLMGDHERKRVTDVTLLQYCDRDGSRMQVTARTAVAEPTHRPRESHLFLANFVGLEGRWFAEHDFLSKANPFKPTRLTVAGPRRVHYRSVLYLPIFTANRPAPLGRGEQGPVQDVIDYCIGVICVHSKRPFRFWRWGDHRKDNGGGFGNESLHTSGLCRTLR